MAVDMFIKIKGVDGESQDSKHSKEIDVLSWNWGMSNSGSAHMAGAGAGKVSVQNLKFSKYVDSATPKLMLACCDGTHFDEVNLTVRKAGGSAVEYIKIKLQQVIISSLNTGETIAEMTGGSAKTGAKGGEDRLTETVELSFAKFQYNYTPQDDKGKAGTTIVASWNRVKNIADV